MLRATDQTGMNYESEVMRVSNKQEHSYHELKMLIGHNR